MICSYRVTAEAVMDDSRAPQRADALDFPHAHHARRACGEPLRFHSPSFVRYGGWPTCIQPCVIPLEIAHVPLGAAGDFM